MHVNMLNDIHLELIQTFNPLYAIPIVAVVFCAFLVYAFGFKSPAPPPIFENDKKYSKKRKNKEIQKQSKSVVNGKTNGLSSSKGKISEIAKKKESSNLAVSEKASKKVKPQSDKRQPQEKRKDSIPHEDLNDDGWVQLVSKKGRKNRKKDDNSVSDAQSKITEIIEPLELIKSEIISVIEETKPVPIEKPAIDNSITEKEMKPNDKPAKKAKKNVPPSSKSEKIPTSAKPSDKEAEKNLKTVTKTTTEDIEKTKNIKNPIPPPSNQNENNKKVKDVDSIFVAVEDPVIKENAATNASVSKSNVAFDELAGLYPETKEKKKKKVRRDH